jgi:hypothetical protein
MIRVSIGKPPFHAVTDDTSAEYGELLYTYPHPAVKRHAAGVVSPEACPQELMRTAIIFRRPSYAYPLPLLADAAHLPYNALSSEVADEVKP